MNPHLLSLVKQSTCTCSFKSWKVISKKYQKQADIPNVPNQADVKRDSVINQQNYNFSQF